MTPALSSCTLMFLWGTLGRPESLASTIRGACVYYPGPCVYYPRALRLLSAGLAATIRALASTIPEPCVYYPGACVYYPGPLRLLSRTLASTIRALASTIRDPIRNPCVYYPCRIVRHTQHPRFSARSHQCTLLQRSSPVCPASGQRNHGQPGTAQHPSLLIGKVAASRRT
jgi:hypothetical protein